MNYFSTNKNSPVVDFKTATVLGQAPDRGLYYPELIPVWDDEFLDAFKELSQVYLAYKVMKPYVGDTIPDATLFDIVEQTINFPFPLVKVKMPFILLNFSMVPRLLLRM